jgi:transcriptional regulator with XRE-family HTH domain
MDTLQTAIDRARRRRGFPSPAERRLLRLRAGLTQADVAVSLGTTTAAVSRYESGDREPRGAILDAYLTVLERLANANTA